KVMERFWNKERVGICLLLAKGGLMKEDSSVSKQSTSAGLARRETQLACFQTRSVCCSAPAPALSY
ncbi:hypothetical protein A2U01_0047085, partial [Trifolium medium]|nr:hypothetical protein [Trifolium medium]